MFSSPFFEGRRSRATLVQLVAHSGVPVLLLVFMNRFRKLGLIQYNDGLRVHSALLNVVLHN